MKNLTLRDSEESSKRFLALFTGVLIAVCTILYTTPNNLATVLTILCSYVLALVGVSAWLANKTK